MAWTWSLPCHGVRRTPKWLFRQIHSRLTSFKGVRQYISSFDVGPRQLPGGGCRVHAHADLLEERYAKSRLEPLYLRGHRGVGDMALARRARVTAVATGG